MMELNVCKGSLVYSRAGRDKGGLFLVIRTGNGYVYLADGKLRTVEAPKKKKLRHINRTNRVLETDVDEMSNSDVRKALAEYSVKDDVGR